MGVNREKRTDLFRIFSDFLQTQGVQKKEEHDDKGGNTQATETGIHTTALIHESIEDPLVLQHEGEGTLACHTTKLVAQVESAQNPPTSRPLISLSQTLMELNQSERFSNDGRISLMELNQSEHFSDDEHMSLIMELNQSEHFNNDNDMSLVDSNQSEHLSNDGHISSADDGDWDEFFLDQYFPGLRRSSRDTRDHP